MGGVSRGRVSDQIVASRRATRLTGTVSLENSGGFIQMASNVQEGSLGLDTGKWAGIQIDVFGNGEAYDMRLRTEDLQRPWQSYRAQFRAPSFWTTICLPFSAFEPHRTETILDPAKLRRIGIVAVGRAFHADIAVSDIRLF